MAYFLLSKKKLFEQYNLLKKYVDKIAYNLKANLEVGLILNKYTESLFSVSSKYAINKIKDKNKIIYLIQGETEKELKDIYLKGVKKFIVDNDNDLKKIINFKGIDLFIRIKLKEHTVYTGKYFVYGFSWEKINELIKELKNNKNINSINIHFHRKTQNVGEWYLVNEFEEILDKKNYKNLEYISIGGGLPVRYANSNPNIDTILQQIKNFKKFLEKQNTKLMAEPGRFLAAPPIRLITFVKNIYRNTIILDCSLYNSHIDTILFNHRLPVLGEKNSGQAYLLKGNSPDSYDIFRYKVYLKDIKIGSKIIFENAGAYNFHTEFNFMKKLKTKVVNDF